MSFGNLVQEASDSANEYPHDVTYTSATTSGNVLVSVFKNTANHSGNTPVVVPSGWTLGAEVGDAGTFTLAIAYKVSDGTETSVSWGDARLAARQGTVWVGEFSGLTGATPNVSVVSDGAATSTTSRSTGTTATTTAANTAAFAVACADAVALSTTPAWTNSFASNYNSGDTSIAFGTKAISATGTVETTFSHGGAGDEMVALVLVWEAASTVTGTFDNIDVTAITTPTVGNPFTSASHSITADFTDGTDSASLAVTYNPKAGYAVQEITSAVKTTGSVFENFVGTIPDTSQVMYPTANNTSVDATGILTTDATSNFYMHYWDATSGEWDRFEVIIDQVGSNPSNPTGLTGAKTQVRSMVRSQVSSQVQSQVK